LSAVERHSVEPGLIPALARHLEHLKDNPDGVELFQLIQKSLVYCRQQNYVNASCIGYLHAMLQDYTKYHCQSPAVRIRAHLIQQYLALYLPRLNNASPAKTATNTRSVVLRAAPAQGTSVHAKSASAHHDSTQIQNEHPHPKTSHVDTLLREREALAQKLSDANNNLKIIEAEREQLRTELDKIRGRARTNEKSLKKLGLPKHNVLLRQIQAEVERVNRYGNPLALALIDVDDLEKLNDQHGKAVTKAVLDHYTSEILGNFRSYDLVARYNKDEFAVLLPNTDKDNAARALEKIRKRASESHFSHKGRSYPLPGFGGVLTFYAPGEEPQQLLQRANEALVNLKLRGERQFVVV
jgi:diguanylate cyclase (GGDEF)-like protein